MVLMVNGKILGLFLKMLSGDFIINFIVVMGNVKFMLGGFDIDVDFVVFDGILYVILMFN